MKRRILFFAFVLFAQCSSSTNQPPGGPQPLPGEQTCDPNAVLAFKLSFDPPNVVVAPGAMRPARLIVDPDVCTPASVSFTSGDATIVAAPASAQVDLRHATYDFVLTGGARGTTQLTATMMKQNGTPYTNQDGSVATGTLPVDVRDPTVPLCVTGDTQTGTLSATAPTASGRKSLVNASVGSDAAAFGRTDWLGLPTFDVSIGCGTEMAGALPGYVALSPAVTFTPTSVLAEATPLRREIDFAIPVNPADFPTPARMRHLEVLFSNVKAKTPRPISIASPRIEATADGNYVLKFSSPWFGAYQAAVRSDAGTRTHTRHLTHRAVIGISMGGGGAATFGFHHHDEFDAIGPMGGPSDWTWLGWFVEHYALGGFCPASDPTCTLPGPSEYPSTDTYMHTEDFNHWWYEAGSGNGGHFPRSDYEQIFTDLALMRGNPNGDNDDPDQTHMAIFAAGPKATDPWVTGDTSGLPPGTNCAFTLSPINTDPNYADEQSAQSGCAKTRCDAAHTFVVPSGYYDDEYNPDGSQQVISVCDGNQIGSANNDSASPYENTFVPPTPDSAYPLSLGLAVDLNKNGVRDENEPIIRSGHEPWTDTGVDGLADANEPGYDAATNPDPNGDDYDPYINPTGTENDHRYELGEPFQDYGMDGVPNTKSSPYDKGEGDGVFTIARGLQSFYDVDPHSILRGWSKQTTMSDDDLARFSIWSDGGVRDLFNFAAVATHLSGAISSRRTSDGHAIQPVAFYNNFNMLPGEDPTSPDNFIPSLIRWADLAAAPSLRYGTVDASAAQISQGDGQHVGTGAQILYRVEAAFYFVAHQWPDADRLLTNPSNDNLETVSPNVLCDASNLGACCEVTGHCEATFTGAKSGRSGPIAITLPPGYANEDNRARNVRYPVVFVLHGYGQKPEDLEALQLISNNFMNDGNRSYENRLAKFIAVYVDGRCREGTAPNGSQAGTPPGQPECIQGGFYLDSTRPGGALFDTWFDELVQYVDKNYRTMPPSDVTVTE
ncbi:MAG TPA: hypothetical protein VGH28_30405 [Polyangiaceae bacterium]